MGVPTIHKKDIVLNKNKLRKIIRGKGFKFIDVYDKIVKKYGLDLSYKGFMSLLDNRSTWKLLYAYAIIETLNISIDDVFEIVDVDVEQKKREIEEWKEKYQK